MPEPQVDPIRNVAKRVKEVVKDQGLNLINFSCTPSLDDGPDKVTLVFEYDPDRVNEPELIIQEADRALVEQMEEQRRKDMERRADQARKSLDDLLGDDESFKGRKGFLDDFMEDN